MPGVCVGGGEFFESFTLCEFWLIFVSFLWQTLQGPTSFPNNPKHCSGASGETYILTVQEGLAHFTSAFP